MAEAERGKRMSLSLSSRKMKRTEEVNSHPVPEEVNSYPVPDVGPDKEDQHSGRCFASPVKDEAMKKAKCGVVPSNTVSANQWALKNFKVWSELRNSRSDEQVLADLLQCHDAVVVCMWLCYFVQETRKEAGHPYPPRSLKQLLCGLKRIMDSNKVPFNIFDRSNMQFRDFHMVCNSACSDLLKQGIGSTVRHAQTIPMEHEDKFWELGLLGTEDPRVLQVTVFYYIGLHFVLRRGEEQHSLKQSQFIRSPADLDLYDEEPLMLSQVIRNVL